MSYVQVIDEDGCKRTVKVGSDAYYRSRTYEDQLAEEKETLIKNQNKMKKAKITHIQGNGTWNDLFKFEVTMDNNDTGTVFSKTQEPKFVVGEEKSYEITPSGRGHKIKWIQEQRTFTPSNGGNYSSNNSQGKEESIARAVALKASVDMNHSDNPAKIIEVAQLFERYLIHGIAPTDDAQDNARSNAKMDSDDLPF